MKISVKAAAKINLTLDITGKRPDGYHELSTVMQSVGLYEYVTLETNDSAVVTLDCDKAGIPCDDTNIASKCARAFYDKTGVPFSGLHISIQKNIPAQAGLAGGSADGAAVLVGLNKMNGEPLSEDDLIALGGTVGADIPFCIKGGTVLAQGIGERLTLIAPIPDCNIVIVKPSVGISTAQAYGAVDSVGFTRAPSTEKLIANLGSVKGIAENLRNDFEDALDIAELKALTDVLKRFDGCLGACMSGSGSAVFAIFEEENAAVECVREMAAKYEFAAAVHPVTHGTQII